VRIAGAVVLLSEAANQFPAPVKNTVAESPVITPAPALAIVTVWLGGNAPGRPLTSDTAEKTRAEAERPITGCSVTVIGALALVVPPGPVQNIKYVVVAEGVTV
jgi:hypothetical protein